MPTKSAIRLTAKIGLCLMTSSLMACSAKPPVINADTSCVRFKHIDVNEFQVDAMKKDPGTWRPLAVQILGHNQEYDKACVKDTK